LVTAQEIREYLANKKVVWKFIADKDLWWDGFGKWLEDMVKCCLRKSAGWNTLMVKELTTVVVVYIEQ